MSQAGTRSHIAHECCVRRNRPVQRPIPPVATERFSVKPPRPEPSHAAVWKVNGSSASPNATLRRAPLQLGGVGERATQETKRVNKV